ncbi:peptidylprolyl isomerase [Candidatus Pelagibacter sp.]|uniref:peptidylprolyl isomerase n=1 Tax=Candidatus Pelagibacter sp. TaxID=2024849 RepID=UPI003F878975
MRNFNKTILKIFFILIFFFNISLNSNSYENKILFKVDNEIITTIDLLNEIEYRKLLNDKLNKLEKNRLFEIVKKSLIREKIKKIVTLKFFDTDSINEKNLDLIISQFIKKTNFQSKDHLQKFLSKKDINIETIIEKIKIEVLWNELIVAKFSQNIVIDKSNIRKNILENNIQKNFLLSEIVFDLENENLDEKYNKIKKEIYENGFENAASNFSISDSAKEGGKIGWIKFNSLSDAIKKEILTIKKNEFSRPILIPGGFLILKIEDEKKTNIVTNIDLEVENISREIANKQLNQFSNIYFNKVKKEFDINEL